MKKWTTTVASSKISLKKALSIRHGPLNEVECWALLSAVTRDLMNNDTDKKPPIFCLENTILTSSGKVLLERNGGFFSIGEEFRHPGVITEKKELDAKEFEQVGIYSLGKTLDVASKNAILSNKLEYTIETMVRSERGFKEIHTLSSNELLRLTGSCSSDSKFIAQLCKMSQGSTSTSFLRHYHQPQEDEIEFSRLDTSTSSGSPEPPALPPKRRPDAIQHNFYKGEEKRNTNFKRNPSRLYRVVEPLTKISTSPIPATKRCVGPEIFVMNEKPPIALDITAHSRRDSISKKVAVVMISGQRIVMHVTPSSVTAGEVLERALQSLDIKESSLFALATINPLDEYLILASDTKLSKVSPSGWKDASSYNNGRSQSSSDSFTLYQRFKFLPEDMDSSFKDANNKHQFYLQCRRDFVDSRFRLSVNQSLSLAAMALQVEFGDYNDDIHEEGGEYFVLEHYLPSEIIKEFGRKESYSALYQLHKAYFGQSQSKTEVKFCKEIQKLSHYGFHLFTVYENKKIRDGKRLLGIHHQGIFFFEKSHTASGHALVSSFYWNQIVRIQFDKSHFHLAIKSDRGNENVKHKYYLPIDIQAKVMFDLAAAHHQRFNQIRYASSPKCDAEITAEINYKEPAITGIRSLKNKLLNRRQLSQRRLYTKTRDTGGDTKNKNNLRRCTTLSSTTVKRLTHYSSMADAAAIEADLDSTDKENRTPDKNYRYKVYLEPDDDECTPESRPPRIPLQERPVKELIETPLNRGAQSRRRISTIVDNQRRRSESVTASARRGPKSRLSQGPQAAGPCSAGMRMGTRISMSALHRERIRVTSDLSTLPPAPKKRNLDLDFETMEFKSLPARYSGNFKNPRGGLSLPQPRTHRQCEEAESEENYTNNESLSDSLIERFDRMESDESSQPEREIVSIVLSKDSQGRLGLKITGTPSGIYIDAFDSSGVMVVEGRLKPGDRIIAINGRSLENVTYNMALELIKRSPKNVQFLVSQVKS